MDLAIAIFIAGILVGLIVPACKVQIFKNKMHSENLGLRNETNTQKKINVAQDDALRILRFENSSLKESVKREHCESATNLRLLREARARITEMNEAASMSRDLIKALRAEKSEQNIMVGERIKKILSLQNTINAIHGADSKRASAVGTCDVQPFSGGFFGFSLEDEVSGPIADTKWAARRKFESMLGLRDKIKWAD